MSTVVTVVSLAMHDLAVIIVSTHEAGWLRGCLPTVFAGAEDLAIDVVVVANGGGDGTRALVESEFPRARVVECDNHGFPHANNRALMTIDARYVLFLNPDTEIVEGSLAELVARMDASPEVGLAGCRQLQPDGELHPTMRRFPTAIRLLMEAAGSERWPFRASWTGQRLLDLDRYTREIDIDWTSGSFMLARREALESAGWLDERLFLYCDDPDLARRIKSAGWTVRHLPQMLIIHHAGKMGWNARGYAQYAYANRVYFAKHFGGAHRRAAVLAAATGYGLRALLFPLLRPSEPDAVHAMRAAFSTVIGRVQPPYEPPPPTAVRPRRMPGAAAVGPEASRAQEMINVAS
jgi:N-acetylglucosaminyl-diphospho-decaprenol L-rhamnosyltransferase